jgi:alpha-tubulin suppressor-like RCC1 family protein
VKKGKYTYLLPLGVVIALGLFLWQGKQGISVSAPAENRSVAPALTAPESQAGQPNLAAAVQEPKALDERAGASLTVTPGAENSVQVQTPTASPEATRIPTTTEPTDAGGKRGIRAEIAALMAQKHDLSDPAKRAALVQQVRKLEDEEMAVTREKAARLGLPMVRELEGGGKAFLVGFDGDQPEYLRDENVNAAISTTTNLVRSTFPYQVNGSGQIFGLWEAGGIPRLSHQEFGSPTKVTVRDGSTTVTSHATHVAGTLAAQGVNPALLGMAPGATIEAYDANNDLSEMLAAGAAGAGEAGKIFISNHSYGYARGWDGTTWLGTFTDDGNPANDVDTRFGRYDATSVSVDGMLYNLPSYLSFYSAGNARNDGPPAAGTTWYHLGISRDYDPAQHPAGNGAYKAGYDLLDMVKGCKNLITVGAANDAVSAGVRSVANSTLTVFSSTGPTDDGRIKPDIVANGASLLSSSSASDTATGSFSGTSMAAPNAAGSAMLLVDYYQQRFPGQAMRASTLKGLIIHTADDVGRPGPDYEYGWGLMNTKAAADLIKLQADTVGSEHLTEELLPQGGSHTYTFTWDGVSPIRATLCWTDPAGTPVSAHDNRSRDLTNDLNLKVTAPGGSTHLPFVMPYVGDWSEAKLTAAATTGVNTVDNVEQVLIQAPAAGQYVVTVDHAGSLTHGEQAYSLILTGGEWLDVVQVSPMEGFEVAGMQGGPFTPSNKVYTLSNFSEETIQWTAATNASWVQLSPTSGTLAPDTSAEVTVTLGSAANALTVGFHQAQINITDVTSGDAVITRSLILQAQGSTPVIVVEGSQGDVLASGSSTVTFDQVTLGSTSSTRSFTVSNSIPGSSLELGALTFTGPDAACFSVTTPPAAFLAGGEKTTFTVSYSPLAAGQAEAVLNIGSNAVGSPFKVNLTGSGVAAPGPAQQIISANVTVRKPSGGAFPLNAYATSSLPLEYTVLSGPVSVNANGVVTPTGGNGAVTIRINQAGGSGYAAAETYITFVMGTGFEFAKVFAGSGESSSFGIKSDGTLWSWGTHEIRLGNAPATTFVGRVTPLQVGTETNWQTLAVGASHVIGLQTNGKLYAWGSNTSGPLGDGTVITKTTPVAIQPAFSWTSIAAGTSFSAAIRADGTLWTWGINTNGQLGQGNTTSSTVPIQVGTTSDWQQVACGSSFVLALKTNGELWAWGVNTSGQLGNGSTTQSTSPARVGTDDDWEKICAGFTHSLAIKANGSLWAWGSASSGQLGNGSSSANPTPGQVGSDTDWVSLAANTLTSCAIKSNGTLWVWGGNNGGMLGDGTISATQWPKLLTARTDWVDISCGIEHLLALDSSGVIWVSGHADGLSGAAPRSLALAHQAEEGWSVVSGRSSAYAGIRQDGSLWTWGQNDSGVIGGGTTSPSGSTWLPSRVGSANDWRHLSTGLAPYMFGIKTGGTLWGWGINTSNRLGDGATTSRTTPVQIGSATDWRQVAAGNAHSMGVKTNGTLWGWGINTSGQLGDGGTTARTIPGQTGVQTDWSLVSCGGTFTHAIKTDGTLWAWGAGSGVGAGSTSPQPAPVKISMDTTWVQVSDGLDHGLALKANGTLWSWGLNSSGQLGLGDLSSRLSPTQVGTDTDWVKITAGTKVSAAIKADGSLWVCGSGTYGMHGKGHTNDLLVFTRVSTDSQFTEVMLGESNLMALRSDGSFWTAGTAQGARMMAGGRENRRQVPVLPGLSGQTMQAPGANYKGWESVRLFGSSGLPATSIHVISGPAVAEGNQVFFNGSGTVRLSAAQFGDEIAWDAAPPEEFSFTVDNGLSVVFATPGTVGLTATVFLAAGVELDMTLGFAPSLGQTLTLVNNTGSGPVIGELPGLQQDGFFYLTHGGVIYGFRVDYTGGDGNDITLTHERVPQVIDLAEINPKSVNDQPFVLQVASNSGLPVGVEVLSGPASLAAGTVTLHGIAGAVTLRATLPGNNQFYAAEPVVGTFVVTDGVFRFIDVSTAKIGSHALAVDTAGGLWAWGNGTAGHLGSGSSSTQYVPVKIGAVSTWAQVSAGLTHSMGIRTNGTLWAWGTNSSGQLGDGTNTARSNPVQIGSFTNWLQVEGAGSYTVALRADGSLWSWGVNGTGQLGDGTSTARNSPGRIGSASDWASISAGSAFNMALKTDGSLWCWGSNSSGELGDGTTTSRSSPVRIGSSYWKSIAAGNAFSLAVRQDGSLWAWGSNSNGQLGDGTKTRRTSPVQIGQDTDWARVEAGNYHSIAVKTDGSVWSWGKAQDSQSAGGGDLTSPRLFSSGTDWALISGGNNVSYVLKTDGSLYAWDEGSGYTGKSVRKLTRALAPAAWTSMHASLDHTLLTKSDGTLWGYGSGSSGQLGAGTGILMDQDLFQIGSLTDWQHAWAGNMHSGAIRQDGSLWMWGSNSLGQLGDGSISTRQAPVQIAVGSTWQALALGSNFTLGIRSNGSLCAWGNNINGQLGDGSTTRSLIPIQVEGNTDWASISAGASHSLALKNNGSLWAWGNNANGQLGLGNNTNRNTPQRVGTDTDWVQMAGYGNSSYGIKSDGSLWAWGLNTSGQLGLGDNVSRTVPVRIGTGNDWKQVSGNTTWAAAVKTDGTLWVWGNNVTGQQGTSPGATTQVPVQVGNSQGWVAVQAANVHITAMREDGSIWTAGFSGGNRLTSSSGRSRYAFAPVLPALVRPELTLPPPGVSSGRITSSSGLPVNLELVSGTGEIQGDHIAHTGPMGSTMVVLAWHPGDETAWDAIPPTQISITTQEILFPSIPDQSVGTPLDLYAIASASSGLPITYTFLEGAGITLLADGVLNFTAPGTVTIRASQGGSESFVTAESVTRTFTVVKGEQVIALSAEVPDSAPFSRPLTLAATSNRGLTDFTYTVLSGPGEVAGNVLTFSALGEVQVQAAQSGNYAYFPALAVKTITAYNTPPVALSDAAQGNEDSAILGLVVGTDFDNQALTFAVVSGPAHGQVTMAANGSFNYSPVQNYHGADSFTFKANDGFVDSPAATMSLTVQPVNDAPTALTQTVTTPDSIPLAITLTGTDIEQDPLSYVLISSPMYGSVTGTPPHVTYIPQPGFAGTDSILFLVNDGQIFSTLGMVEIVVSPVLAEVTQEPMAQKVNQEDDVVFSASAVGSLPMSFHWMKDDVPLPGRTEAILNLSAVTPTDEGVYKLRITNPAGVVTSQGARLTVIGSKPEIQVQPGHKLAAVNEEVVLEVEAMGKPPLAYQWHIKGKPIRGATVRRFRIPSVQLKDAGAYTVTVTAEETVTSQVVQLGVAEDPRLTLALEAGKKATMSLKSAGEGLTHIWKKDGSLLPAIAGLTVSPDQKKLSFKAVAPADEGVYTCEITGPGGLLVAGTHSIYLIDDAPDITPLAVWDFLPPSMVGHEYHYQVPVDQNPRRRPESFSAKGLPKGLVMDTSTGIISGSPTSAKPGEYRMKISAKNSVGSETLDVKMTVSPLPEGIVGSFVCPIPRHLLNDDLGGRLDFTTTAAGSFSGKLTLGGRKAVSFKSGRLYTTLEPGSRPIGRVHILQSGNLPPLDLSFILDPDTALITDATLGDGINGLTFDGWKNVWHKSDRPAIMADGVYNLGLELSMEDTAAGAQQLPQGPGYASLLLSEAGSFKMTGRTADGETITGSSFMGPEGQIVVFQPLYKSSLRGSLAGRLAIHLGEDPVSKLDNTIGGQVTWSRPAAAGRLYPQGFGPVLLTAIGQRFVPPNKLAAFLNLPDGQTAQLRFTGLGLDTDLQLPESSLLITPKNTALMPKAGTAENIAGVKCKIVNKTGFFSGSFTLQDADAMNGNRTLKRSSTFQGLLYTGSTGMGGHGYFLLPQMPAAAGENAKNTPIFSGRVTLEAP